MLTGWFGTRWVSTSSLPASRYASRAADLPPERAPAYVHDAHTIAESVVKGFRLSDFCLFPCEPNWIYPICNHYGMTCLAAHDTAFGTTYVADHLPHWQEMLDREFTDDSGSYIGLRSQHTGIEAPFAAGAAGFARFANCLAPERARRLWAVARGELRPALIPDGSGSKRIALPGSGIDFGRYRFGHVADFATILLCAREFGEDDIAEGAQRPRPRLQPGDGRRRPPLRGRLEPGQRARTAGGTLSHGDFRSSVVEGPPKSVFEGPRLAERGTRTCSWRRRSVTAGHSSSCCTQARLRAADVAHRETPPRAELRSTRPGAASGCERQRDIRGRALRPHRAAHRPHS
jgi:hypothetical protein